MAHHLPWKPYGRRCMVGYKSMASQRVGHDWTTSLSLSFYDLQPLLKLACTDTYVTKLLLVSNSGAICTVSLVMLMFSYAIILHYLRNHSADGRKKALSTCISHTIVIILFFGPCIFIYTCSITTFFTDNMIAVFYTIGTPLFNPLIYTLRNAEVKNAMRILWQKKLISDDRRWVEISKFIHCLHWPRKSP